MSVEDRMQSLVRPEIQALSAYHVPKKPDAIKLDAMENPYPWPTEMKQQWGEVLQTLALNRYPDPSADALTAQIKTSMAVPEGCEVLLGNGSDELIQLIALAVAKPDGVMMAADPSFVVYGMTACFLGMRYETLALDDNFDLPLEAALEAIATHQPSLIYLAYPNNPTGNLFSEATIEAIIKAAPGLVVVDEAYQPFTGGASFLSRIGEFDNLLVMRTFSKLGLAGLRLGYLVGAPEWINQIHKVRMPYNINVVTQASVAFALQHLAVFEQQAANLCAAREQMREALRAFGLKVFDSAANFLLVRTQPGQAKAIHQGLLERGVLIKCLDGSAPSLHDCLRISIGTEEENALLMGALSELL